MCPVVTVDAQEYERFELTSAPADPSVDGDENGYVMLRPLPYGLKLQRSDKALKMQMRTRPQDHNPKGGGENVMELQTANEWSTAFDYAYCIGDHNLTDKNGKKVDFTNSMCLKQLNPKVGTELSTLIDKLNEDEDTQSAEDLVRAAFSSSEVTSDRLQMDSGDQETLTEPRLSPVSSPDM